MLSAHRSEKYLLPVLIGGFGLLFLLLLGSGIVALDAMRFMESDAARFVAEQQATARLIYQVQNEEGDLSSVFYSLASGRGADRTELLKRLDVLESAIRATTHNGRAAGSPANWDQVQRAADSFIAEGRDTLRSGRAPSGELFQRHQKLLDALSDLTSTNFTTSALTAEKERLSSRVGFSRLMLEVALFVAVCTALLTVNLANRMFRQLRWQAAELASLSSRTMSDQEETARRLSREMHDHFGQTLSAIEANLVAMRHAKAFHTGRLEDCLGLVKDAVDNVREVSQLLRPTILDDFGLNASLRWLAEGFAERTGVKVDYQSTFDARLSGDSETQLFRIAQEALTNISRHSGATEVRMEIATSKGEVVLTVEDNGKGFDETSPGRGTGMIGMRARARAVQGRVTVESKPSKGTQVRVSVPLSTEVPCPEKSVSY